MIVDHQLLCFSSLLSCLFRRQRRRIPCLPSFAKCLSLSLSLSLLHAEERGLPNVMLLQTQLACKQKQEEKAGIESNISSAGKVRRGRAKRVYRNESTVGTGSRLKENSGCMKRKSKGKHVVRDYKQSAKTFSTGNSVLLGPSSQLACKQK